MINASLRIFLEHIKNTVAPYLTLKESSNCCMFFSSKETASTAILMNQIHVLVEAILNRIQSHDFLQTHSGPPSAETDTATSRRSMGVIDVVTANLSEISNTISSSVDKINDVTLQQRLRIIKCQINTCLVDIQCLLAGHENEFDQHLQESRETAELCDRVLRSDTEKTARCC